MMTKEILTISTIAVLLTTTALAITSIPSYQPALAQGNATQEANQTGGNMTTTTGGGGNQETANKQLDQAMKALDSGDNAVAEAALKEADNTLSWGEAKMHISEAMKSLQAGDTEGAKMHAQIAQGLL